nr:hypothetical protein [Tanacetum cinerariifolium]
MEEMMITTTAFIRWEAAAACKKKGHQSWKPQDQSKRYSSDKRSDFQGHPRGERGSNRFTPLTKTPKEILATEASKFQPPPPMVTPVEKGSSNKFYDFHKDKRHSTDECMRLKKQIEELVRAGKLSHPIKDIKQGQAVKNRKERNESQRYAHGNLHGAIMAKDSEAKGDSKLREDGGFSMEILYEHCFNRPRPEIKSQMVPTTTSLTCFSGETIWPLGQLRLLVTIGDATHSTKAWMNFMVVKSMSPYNGIIGRHGLKPIQAVPEKRTRLANFTVALHPDFPDKEIVIEGSLSDKGHTKLCSVLKKNMDIFAWQPSDMIGVQKLVDARIMREVYYHDWLSNPVMVKKHDGSWQISRQRKTAFHTGQGVYCYTKMPFGLKNAGATYQRLMDKAFESQVGRNIEVYVDDLVVKSHTQAEVVRDIEEMFRTLCKINMKLNPKKCLFGLGEGVFLGYVITPEGIKPCPDKTAAVLELPSPQTVKESDFHWTAKAEQAFQQLEQHLSDLPLLVVPNPREELIIYLSATYGAVSAVLMMERRKTQRAAAKMEHYAGRAQYYIQIEDFAASNNEAEYEALVAGLRIAMQMGVKNIQVNVDSKLVANQVLGMYVAKEDNMIKYLEIVKGLVLVEVLENKSIKEKEVAAVIVEDGPTWMTQIANYLKEDVLPGDNKEARKFRLKAHKYELMEGVLYRRSFLTLWLRCIGPLQANYVMREIHEGLCSMHARPISVVAKAIRLGYYWPTMHKDAHDMIQKCNDCPFPEGPGKVKFLIVAMDHFTKWVEAKAVATITGGERFASVKHPQSNGLTERANRSLREGIKAGLGEEIGMPTYRTASIDVVNNDKELRLNLDLLEEHRERAAICEAGAKSKMMKYYNAKVCGVAFKPGDFIYRSNDTSHAVAGGKL